MAETLAFEITYLYADSAEGIAIPVTIFSTKGMYNTWAKVDTGAEVCPFSNEVGLRLGLHVERGIPKMLGSIGGTMIESFGHDSEDQDLWDRNEQHGVFRQAPRNNQESPRSFRVVEKSPNRTARLRQQVVFF